LPAPFARDRTELLVALLARPSPGCAPTGTAVLAIGGVRPARHGGAGDRRVWPAGAAVPGRGPELSAWFVNTNFRGAKTGWNTIGFIQKYNLKGTEIPASLEYRGRVTDSLNLSDPCYISD